MHLTDTIIIFIACGKKCILEQLLGNVYACMVGVPETNVVCEMDVYVSRSLNTEHRLTYVKFAEKLYIIIRIYSQCLVFPCAHITCMFNSGIPFM